MDLNPVKTAKIANLSVFESLGNVELNVGLNSGQKMIAKLNNDCLAKVLMHVPILERLEMENVCQKWREASELSWYNIKKLDFKNLMINLDEREEILKMIMMRCCRYLKHLTIKADQYPWMDDILKNNCRNIVHFDIEMDIENKYNIPDEDLVEIIMSMKRLKYLKISMYKDSTGDTLNEILQVLPVDINEMHLIYTKRYGFYELPEVLLDKFVNLRCLKLQGIKLTDATLGSILQNKDTLVHLDLTWSELPLSEFEIFLIKLKNLEKLILRRVINLNINVITSIAHNCSKLKHFELDDLLTNPVLPRHFHELKYLNLEHLVLDSLVPNSLSIVGENQISNIANNWKKLKYFDLGGGCHFSLLDLQEITKFKNLEFLNLKIAKVDSQSLLNIASNCLELRELTIDLKDISEIALESLTNLKKLENLTFTYCANLTGNLLSKIALNCKNLVDLSIFECSNVTKASLIQVGKLENLKRLVLYEIKDVPNEMFFSFRKLEKLSCASCPSVTDEGIIKVLDSCPNLFLLCVKKTGITIRSIVYASKRQTIFTPLEIVADESLKNDCTEITSTSYLHVRFA